MPFTRHSDHLRLAIRLTPNVGRNSVDGMEFTADGETFLKARVTAVPENGKANKALVALLADTLRLPKSSITIINGETARKKILRIEGDPEDIEKAIAKLAES